MQISDKYRNKKIAILGAFGIEGLETQKYLARHGLVFDVLDRSDDPDYLDRIFDYEVLFRSPGLSPLLPQMVAAKEAGIVLTSQTEEFFDLCPCKIIGVTGTKGKGTTSTLIFDILIAAGRDAYLGGNIGNPGLSFIDELTPESIVVLELSSFQLQSLNRSPNTAVLLNVTSEHLDYHKDTEEYREAKTNIARYQEKDDIAIINADYEVPDSMVRGTKSKKLYFSRKSRVEGCYVDNDESIVLRYGSVDTVLAITSDMKLRGRHNLENITAAALAASVNGAPEEIISKTIKNFHGLEHRLELVREIDGVHYYDDSFSTVPETAIAALDSFTEPIVLIAGGSSKGSDYTEFGKKVATANIRALVLIGQTAREIEESIKPKPTYTIIRDLTTMAEIVEAAKGLAVSGDVVLLSPACASKGLFENYKDRGDKFKEAVRKL